ncbi:MAG: DEAD/DEAH box helicase [Gammaproteobacteria bacterium]|nr:DEAD/DEAH box helicase [Gammaproteobacteria bacterium]
MQHDEFEPNNIFQPATADWFTGSFGRATPVQARGWPSIESGAHSLLVAPTGSGKTLAAFLLAIDRLVANPPPENTGTHIIYVSPLKALVYDIERNLRAPLAGVRRSAERLGETWSEIRVDVRTGDTPAKVRRRQAQHPAHILVTTPESLFLMMGSKARAGFAHVGTIIVDEIHSLAPTKRGAHLALTMERLSEVSLREPQRIGLSATVRPSEVVAQYLGGDRAVNVIDEGPPPRLSLQVSVPVRDMEAPPPSPHTGGAILSEIHAASKPPTSQDGGIWAALYPALLDAIVAHRSTIIFVNSRGLCERLAQRLNEVAERELVRAHHGSVSHDKRGEIEEALKAGELKAIVATSSLELGIDMGAVDLVILVESPGAVSRGLQRVGRAGHQVNAVSQGIIFPKFRGDILESAVIAQRMLNGEIESVAVPTNALDVLAQQVVAMCCNDTLSVDEIERIVRRAHGYREITRPMLETVLDMLSGRYPSADFADLRPLLSWDRASDILSPRRGAEMVSRMNAGTIPDRGLFSVHLGDEGPRIGELDEEMVFETRQGENIMLGASTWRVEAITRDRVIVTPAPGEPGRLPFWRGDGPGRPIELGQAMGRFLRQANSMLKSEGDTALATHLREAFPLDDMASDNLVTYLVEQRLHTQVLPDDKTIVVERFRDELGDWRLCIMTPFGARVHAPWAMAIQTVLSSAQGYEVQVMYTDDGLVLRFADVETLPPVDVLFPEPEDIDELVMDQLNGTALFAGLFRENAARSLLLPRRRVDRRNPLWAQRLKAQNLLATVSKYESFPIVLETYRQALSEVFDLSSLRTLLTKVRARQVRVHEVETPRASPFARALVFAYVAAFIYEQDAPLAERKAQALSLDRNLLAELLGQGAARELIDQDVLVELELELQCVAKQRHARDANELHDLLRRVGDLSREEAALRATDDVGAWFAQLELERRAVPVRIAGDTRWIAAQDASLYRDALGVSPPSGLPVNYLAHEDEALEKLVLRFGRTHGPFTAATLALRFGLKPAQVEPVLRLFEERGDMVSGEISPLGPSNEWCDVQVFRNLKRRTLAKLRNQIAPVDTSTLGRFLPAWHGIGANTDGANRLLEAIRQLEGLALPWSTLVEAILPARVNGFQVDHLDALAATGALVWIGCGASGVRDGRVALYLREHAGVLLASTDVDDAETGDRGSTPLSELCEAIVEALTARGALFLSELEATAAPHTSGREFESALWDLVWAGRVTNDTFGPLRAMSRKTSRARAGTEIAGGRWSLVSNLKRHTEPTRQSLLTTQVLLERYAIVSREAAMAEKVAGGFSRIYQVLKSMEEAGRLRRGYFVEGLSGAQFAHVGAVDRLRTFRSEMHEEHTAQTLVLSAIDPANPYGSILPWPAVDGAEIKPRRVAGAWVISVSGHALLYLGANRRQLLIFGQPTEAPANSLELAFGALHDLPAHRGRRSFVIEKINGEATIGSKFEPLLRAVGFVSDHRGLTRGNRPPARESRAQ